MRMNKMGWGERSSKKKKKWPGAAQGSCLHVQELELCSLFLGGGGGQR